MKALHTSPVEYVASIDPQAEFAIMLATALRLEEVAERLAISPRQVQAHIADGSLIAVNVGRGGVRRDLRVLEDDLEGFLKRRRTAVEQVTQRPPARIPHVPRPPGAPVKPDYVERREARLARRRG